MDKPCLHASYVSARATGISSLTCLQIGPILGHALMNQGETMSEPINEGQQGPKRTAATRSPSYPYVDLKVALQKAEAFRVKEGRNPASLEVAATHWGYSPKSSGAKQTTAALRAFGLMEADGPLKLTDVALRVLLDKRDPSPEREDLLQKLALKPPMHQRLWERYGTSLPSSANLRHHLIFDYGFNENAVDDFIEEYKATIEFARLEHSDSMPPEGEEQVKNDPSGRAIQSTPQVQEQSHKEPPPPPPSLIGGGSLTPVTFPLSGDNVLEIRLKSKISKAEFDRLKPILVALLELSVVENG